MLTRFDAYTATTRAATAQDLISMSWQLGDKIRHGRGHHGFAERASFTDHTGSEGGSVSWGGTHGDLIMIETKGERTPVVVDRLRERFEHRCTRVDSCYDVEEEGAFLALLEPCWQIKEKYKLKGSKAGDWDHFPDDGRTLYIGANTSPVKLRLYEKGKQPEYRHAKRPDWVRIELQVRPAKDAKDTFSKADSLSVWGASAWSRELAGMVLYSQISRLPAGTVHKLSEQDRALRFMCKQYGAHMMGLKNELGEWEDFGVRIGEMIRTEMMVKRKS